MPGERTEEALLLVLDTCAGGASLALFRGSVLLQEDLLAERAASATLLGALRRVLGSHNVRLTDLAGVGVVNGPGSFTGVRVGLAVAKGLCEAAGIPLAAVSRLAVLAEAAGLEKGIALLGAGRDQIFVRQGSFFDRGLEWLASLQEVESLVSGQQVAVASPELAEQLGTVAAEVQLIELSAGYALGAVQRCFANGGSDLPTTDANYVRNEEAIYAKSAAFR